LIYSVAIINTKKATKQTANFIAEVNGSTLKILIEIKSSTLAFNIFNKINIVKRRLITESHIIFKEVEIALPNFE